MHIIDSHFHWRPRSIYEELCKTKGYPRAEPDGKGGYNWQFQEGDGHRVNISSIWFDLDKQFEHMDSLGHDIEVVSSIGPFSVYFSQLQPDAGRDAALRWNEEMAAAQKKHSGRFWGTAAIPLTDTAIAIEVLDHAVEKLGLIGANLPGSIGTDQRIDAERLWPFYERVEALGIPLFLHPTDAIFPSILRGYNGALHLGLGRVIEVSVAASRLILSGLMEHCPCLKIVLSHTGGALPYQAGRMDKNSRAAKLPRPVSDYMKRMFTDTVSPHALGIKFALEYYGIDHVMYGSDYPCWDPAECLSLISELNLSAEDQQKLFHDNAARLLNLPLSLEANASEQMEPVSLRGAA